jgi:hypothetical protein
MKLGERAITIVCVLILVLFVIAACMGQPIGF